MKLKISFHSLKMKRLLKNLIGLILINCKPNFLSTEFDIISTNLLVVLFLIFSNNKMYLNIQTLKSIIIY